MSVRLVQEVRKRTEATALSAQVRCTNKLQETLNVYNVQECSQAMRSLATRETRSALATLATVLILLITTAKYARTTDLKQMLATRRVANAQMVKSPGRRTTPEK